MDLRAFSYLFIRFHGMLLMFYAAIELTDLPYYIRMINLAEGDPQFHKEARQDLGVGLLRFGLQALLGLYLLAKTKKVIGMFMADIDPKNPDQAK